MFCFSEPVPFHYGDVDARNYRNGVINNELTSEIGSETPFQNRGLDGKKSGGRSQKNVSFLSPSSSQRDGNRAKTTPSQLTQHGARPTALATFLSSSFASPLTSTGTAPSTTLSATELLPRTTSLTASAIVSITAPTTAITTALTTAPRDQFNHVVLRDHKEEAVYDSIDNNNDIIWSNRSHSLSLSHRNEDGSGGAGGEESCGGESFSHRQRNTGSFNYHGSARERDQESWEKRNGKESKTGAV